MNQKPVSALPSTDHAPSALRLCTLAMSVLALSLSFTASARAQQETRASASALQALNGTYKSTAPEDWGRGTFGTREFGFRNGTWTLKFVLALDPGMTLPVFEFRTLGTYRVNKPSATVPGAFDALFLEDKKFVTLRTADPKLIESFGLAGCGLQPNVEKDISAEGCALWKSVAACREDHDLLSLDRAGNLYFGVRPADNDMCTADKRPTRLLPAVRKVN